MMVAVGIVYVQKVVYSIKAILIFVIKLTIMWPRSQSYHGHIDRNIDKRKRIEGCEKGNAVNGLSTKRQ